MYRLQFKNQGEKVWSDDANNAPSNDREALAKKALELARQYPGVSFRVLSPAKEKNQ